MAELTYTGRGSRGAPSPSGAPAAAPQPAQQQHQHQPGTWAQRPSTASPRLEGNTHHHARAAAAASPQQRASSAQRMLAFLDSAERAAAKQPPPPTFPPSGDASPPSHPHPEQQQQQRRQRQRPSSAAGVTPLRASAGPHLLLPAPQPPAGAGAAAAKTPKQRSRQYGRVSLYDHSTAERAVHEVPGPVVLRDLAPARMGFPLRPPESFLRAGEGLSLRQRNQLKEKLRRHPVNVEPPFQPGTGGVRLPPPPGSSPRPLDWGSSPHSPGCPRPQPPSPASPSPSSASPSSLPLPPRTLLRTYYDNGTLDFVAVRWRGNRADALVWARGVSRGPETGGPLASSYVSWAPEPPADLDIATWLPIFIDGVREYDEPYRFIAIRGSEELLLKAGDTLHSMAPSLVPPLRAALTTREPSCVAAALALMRCGLGADPGLAEAWVPYYGQFAQVLNLFLLSRGGSLSVSLGYNSRQVASCRRLADEFLTHFQAAGGAPAAAAVRRLSPGVDLAVTAASQDRAAAKAAEREAEAGRTPGEFRPFTLF